jgi:hypothetical protein
MEIAKPDIFVDQSSDFEESSFSISEQDMGLVFEILRSKVYENPIGSICREICSNARDANREVGKANVPIKVEIEENQIINHHEYERIDDSEKLSSYNLTISDKGPGISPDRMKNVFLKYAASTKRHSNEFTGGFGLGAKTPFSYTDKFTIETVVDGIKYIYIAVVDESLKGKILLLEEKKTKESNGTSIVIPIKYRDRATFEKEIIYYTFFWETRPTLTNFSRESLSFFEINIEYVEIDHKVLCAHFNDNRLSYLFPIGDWISLIDGIPYKTKNYLTVLSSSSDKSILKIIKFENSEIDITVNRENLQYTERTEEKIKSIQSSVLKKAHDFVERLLSVSPSYFEFLITLDSLKNRSLKIEDHRENQFLFDSMFQFLNLEQVTYQGRLPVSFSTFFQDYKVHIVLSGNYLSHSRVTKFSELSRSRLYISASGLSKDEIYNLYFNPTVSTLLEDVKDNKQIVLISANTLYEGKLLEKLLKLRQKRSSQEGDLEKQKKSDSVITHILQKHFYSYSSSDILGSIFFIFSSLHTYFDSCVRKKNEIKIEIPQIIDLDTINLENFQIKRDPEKKEKIKKPKSLKRLFVYRHNSLSMVPFEIFTETFTDGNGKSLDDGSYLYFEYETKQPNFQRLPDEIKVCQKLFSKDIVMIRNDHKKLKLVKSLFNTPFEFLSTVKSSRKHKLLYYSQRIQSLAHHTKLNFFEKNIRDRIQRLHKMTLKWSKNYSDNLLENFENCVDSLKLTQFKDPFLDSIISYVSKFDKQYPLINALNGRKSQIRYYIELEKFKRKYGNKRIKVHFD